MQTTDYKDYRCGLLDNARLKTDLYVNEDSVDRVTTDEVLESVDGRKNATWSSHVLQIEVVRPHTSSHLPGKKCKEVH